MSLRQKKSHKHEVLYLDYLNEGYIKIRVVPDIRPFLISCRIPDIKTIRIPDIRLISNAGYLVIRSVVRLFAGYPA